MKNFKKKTLLVGNSNQHTLYGQFKTVDDVASKDFTTVIVEEESHLKHEQSNGSFGEHNGLLVDTGVWVMGSQVEYNPFENVVSKVWD